MGNAQLEQAFPNLKSTHYQITSSPTSQYNCIAWAADDDTRWWEPGPPAKTYWPFGIPRLYTLDAYIKAYGTLGYTQCDNFDLEKGFEKVTIYINPITLTPTHAAKQKPNGYWTSKLGKFHDIEHTLEGLVGKNYGSVGVVLKRKI